CLSAILRVVYGDIALMECSSAITPRPATRSTWLPPRVRVRRSHIVARRVLGHPRVHRSPKLHRSGANGTVSSRAYLRGELLCQKTKMLDELGQHGSTAQCPGKLSSHA